MRAASYSDVLCIGFGPANLALAIAAEELGSRKSIRYLEAQTGPSWQSGMLLDNSDIQHNPIRDLVSLRNPRSRYTFINYLHETGRLQAYLNLPNDFPLRKDFAKYISWAASQVEADISYGAKVANVRRAKDGTFQVGCVDGVGYESQTLVIGTGRTPYIPPAFANVVSENIIHSTQYLNSYGESLSRTRDGDVPHVLVVGSSQSGVELALDLTARFPGVRVSMLCRNLGPRLRDTSPFSEEAYFPEFANYYFALTRERKRSVDTQLRASIYSSVDADVLHRLYTKLYEQRLDGDETLRLLAFQEAAGVDTDGDGRLRVVLREVNTGQQREGLFDRVILATGFRDLGTQAHQDRVPALLAPLADDLAYDQDGYLLVDAQYQLTRAGGAAANIFLNGLCESTHGLGDAGSFSLLSLRAERILRALDPQTSTVAFAGPSVTHCPASRTTVSDTQENRGPGLIDPDPPG